MARARKSKSTVNASPASPSSTRAASKKTKMALIPPPPFNIPTSAAPRAIHLEDLAPADAPSRVAYLPAGYVPHRPNNGYFWFVHVSARQPNRGVAQQTVIQGYGRQWKALGQEGQIVYEEMAEAEKVIHGVRFPEYKYVSGERKRWEAYVRKNGIDVPFDWSVETDHMFVVDAKGALCYTLGERPTVMGSDSDKDSPGPETPIDEVQSFEGYPYPVCFEAIQYQPVSSEPPYPSSSSSSPFSSLSPSPPPNTPPQQFAGEPFNPYLYPSFQYNYDALCLAGSSHIGKQPHPEESPVYPFLLEPISQNDSEDQLPFSSSNAAFDAFYANVDFASAFDYKLTL